MNLNDIRIKIRQILKEEIDELPLTNVNQKYTFSSDEMYLLYRYIHSVEDYLTDKIKDSNPELNDRRKRLHKAVKLIDKKFLNK